MRVKKFIFIALSITFLIAAKQAFASKQFDTSYNIYYNVYSTGETHIEQKIKITNKQDDILATNYSHTIRQMDIYDVTGWDEKGPLEIDIKSQEDSTAIKMKLNEQVIGEGRSNEFTLSYKTKDIANKVGEVWNITLPQITTLDEINEYNTTINIPKDFGPTIFISPQPKKTFVKNTHTSYIYDKESINNKGITAAFGKYQLLNFKLKYHLKNDSILPIRQEIALPPDIPRVQQIQFEKISPKPKRIYQDNDGNILAEYKIPTKSNLEVTLTGAVRILGRQINPEFGGKMHELPINLKRRYTKEQPFWEVNSAQIQEIANDLFDPQKTVAQNAYLVYNYITENLNYNFDITTETTIERKGALTTLTNEGLWACMEFTDVFIALTRAMGIPARELDGYAINNAETLAPLSVNFKDGDLLHAWAEFYDPNFGWVQIDPTWGTTSGIDHFTKLDTNHFVFAIKGEDSEYPHPAGSYRLENEEKQVSVDFAQEQVEFNEELILYKKNTINPLKILNKKQKYDIYNTGGIIVYNLNGTGKNLLPFEKQSIHLPKDSTEIGYKNFNGVEKTITVEVKTKQKTLNAVIAAIIGTLFITIAAVLIFRKRKKAADITLLSKIKEKLPQR